MNKSTQIASTNLTECIGCQIKKSTNRTRHKVRMAFSWTQINNQLFYLILMIIILLSWNLLRFRLVFHFILFVLFPFPISFKPPTCYILLLVFLFFILYNMTIHFKISPIFINILFSHPQTFIVFREHFPHKLLWYDKVRILVRIKAEFDYFFIFALIYNL